MSELVLIHIYYENFGWLPEHIKCNYAWKIIPGGEWFYGVFSEKTSNEIRKYVCGNPRHFHCEFISVLENKD